MDRIRVEIQTKKEKIKTTPDLYVSDLSSESDDASTFADNKLQSQNLGKTCNSSKFKTTDHSFLLDNNDKSPRRGELITRQLFKYKKIIRGLDVFIAIIAIVTMILSQLENQHYFELNQQRRILIVRIAECLSKGIPNPDDPNNPIICYPEYFNQDEYNTEFEMHNYFNQIDFETREIGSIPLKFKLDSFCSTMRTIILFLTMITILTIIVSRKTEHTREYSYFQKKDVSFYKTSLFYLMLCEVLLIALIQYPNTEKVFFYEEFGHYIIFPLTTFLSTISLLRVTFVIKLLKSLTRWTDAKSEDICEKYACKANESFAFKAFQKENPFSVLFGIFAMSCVCFGLAVKNFECLYWEHREMDSDGAQNWTYTWNAMWFVFVSMTTVGYGDFYPNTQVGRVITIFCCLVGCYFVSSMMVFMTNKTAKNENEEKAFKLITRIQYRKVVKNHQAHLIYLAIQYALLNIERDEEDFLGINGKEMNKIKKKMNLQVKKIKQNEKFIKTCDLAPVKEQLFDIHERITTDIKNIKFELNFLDTLNLSMKKFTNFQLKCLDNLKKDLYSTKMFYDLLSQNAGLFSEFSKLKCPLNQNDFQFGNLCSNQKIPFVNYNEQNQNQVVLEANESEEDDKEMLNTAKYDEYKINEEFNFLFDSNCHTKHPKRCETSKTKILYKEAFDKVEMRKAEREINSNRNKLLSKYLYSSEKSVAHYHKQGKNNMTIISNGDSSGHSIPSIGSRSDN